jgi:hypothetical protein
VEGSAEVGELIERGGVDTAGIEVAYDKAIAFSPSEGVGQHFVRDAIQGVVEFLVSATSGLEFGEHGESPAAVEKTYDLLR